ncbi:MAG: ribosome maturation factor RimM [Marinicaulis sp.]|nr:ribosome maturation factor RimM [Marinicaulis sp.]
MTKSERVCLGAIAGAHGVRGDFRVKYFTEAPENVAAYGPVETEDASRTFTLKFIREAKGEFAIFRAPEIKSREDAEAFKGARLYVSREVLPKPNEDEFYLDDLVGLKVVTENGEASGEVNAVYNFGAGDLLEIKNVPGRKGLHLIPFTRENAPKVDIAAATIVIGVHVFDDTADADQTAQE